MITIKIDTTYVLKDIFIEMIKNHIDIQTLRSMEKILAIPKELEIKVKRSFIERTCKDMLKESISAQVKKILLDSNIETSTLGELFDNWEIQRLRNKLRIEFLSMADNALKADKEYRKKNYLSKKFNILLGGNINE